MTHREGKWLATVVRVSVTIVALTFVALLMRPLLVRIGLISGSHLSAGDRIPLPERVLSSAPPTVVVFGRGSCVICQSAVPGLRHLTEAGNDGSPTVWLVTDDSTDEWAQSGGFSPSRVVRDDLTRFRLQSLPTVIVVDGSGVVLHVQHTLDEAGVAALLAAAQR